MQKILQYFQNSINVLFILKKIENYVYILNFIKFLLIHIYVLLIFIKSIYEIYFDKRNFVAYMYFLFKHPLTRNSLNTK